MKVPGKKVSNIGLGTSAFLLFYLAFGGLSFGAFPVKPITLIVPWAAGGPADLVWRGLAEPMGKILGQPVIVNNKPGGSGALGAVLVKNAAPDGYTIGHVSTSNHLINPYLSDVGYQLQDFTYIYSTVAFPLCLVVRNDAPWKTFQELNQYAKANPLKVRVGYNGPTTIATIAQKWIAQTGGIKYSEVIYKGDPPGLAALLGNHIDAFNSSGSTIPQVKAGQLRMLLTFTSNPIKGFEDVPTFGKIYGKIIDSSVGLAGPKGLPSDVISKLEDAVRQSMHDASFLKLMDSLSMVTVNMNHRELTAYMTATNKTMKEWLDELGLIKK